jgi:GT2 family glycosyltransferase
MARSRGRHCLLLNEDSELLPGAAAALWRASRATPRAACAVARCVARTARRRRRPGASRASAARWPAPLMLGRAFNVQSKGAGVRRVDWGQSAALRCDAKRREEVGWMDGEFFVYSDEVDFQRRLADAGWHTLYVPAAVAIHHEQLSTGAQAARADRRARPRARPLHAQAPRRRGGVCGALAGGLDLRPAVARRARAARPRRAALPRPRARGAAPGAGRGPARGGGALQRRSRAER